MKMPPPKKKPGRFLALFFFLCGLVVALSHAADLAGGSVLVNDTLVLGSVQSRNSDLDGGVLVLGIAVDGSVCLLDNCFQVGLDGLVVCSLFLGLSNAVFLRFNIRHSFHLLGLPITVQIILAYILAGCKCFYKFFSCLALILQCLRGGQAWLGAYCPAVGAYLFRKGVFAMRNAGRVLGALLCTAALAGSALALRVVPGGRVLALSMIFASVMVTGMRLFDAITDPIIGALMDRTNGKFGKFRPFMVIGNLIMAVSILVLYGLTPLIPASMEWARYVAFVTLYAIWVIGYTFQTSCTRSGQTVLTNDPKQRPLFTIFNTVGSLLGMGAMQFFAPILAKNYEGGYASAGFFRTLAPVGIVISIALTILAVIGIWEKDQPKYFGIGGQKTEKIKVAEYVAIIKGNNPMQRLMVAGAGCKLALSIATNTTVLCMLYGCMMGNYDGLYLPMMVLGYVFSVPFFLLTVRTSQKKGQKASLMRYVSVALICYIGVLVLLLLWGKGDAFTLSLMSDGKVSINVYTILFIALFGIGYGAYYATADMPIPMVADCSDYETYISGKYIPGIMGTLFSLVDKLVSSLSATVVGVAVSFIGLNSLPTQYDPYTPGMNVVVIVLFCVIPMIAWAATLLAMKNYSLTGEKMKEIQAVNACRRDAVAGGMSLEDAMQKWQTIDQLPAQYRAN